MVETPFRITPSLGPDLHQTAAEFYWDTISTSGTPSHPLGTKVIGNDGHEYVYVEAAAQFAADAGLSINETTWAASADGSDPVWEAPVAVASGAYFWARRVAL